MSPTVPIETPKVRVTFVDVEGNTIRITTPTADGHDQAGAYWFGRKRAYYGACAALARIWIRTIIQRIELREKGRIVPLPEETFVEPMFAVPAREEDEEPAEEEEEEATEKEEDPEEIAEEDEEEEEEADDETLTHA